MQLDLFASLWLECIRWGLGYLHPSGEALAVSSQLRESVNTATHLPGIEIWAKFLNLLIVSYFICEISRAYDAGRLNPSFNRHLLVSL